MVEKTLPPPPRPHSDAFSQSPIAKALLAAQPAVEQKPSASLVSVRDLRLSQDFQQIASGHHVLVDIAVSKPPKWSFFRASADPSHSIPLCTLDTIQMGGDGVYAVAAEVAALIPDQVRNVVLHLVVTSQHIPFLLPVALPGPDGRTNPWHQSLARAVELAKTSWIRLSANQHRGSYDVFEAAGRLPEPQWPTKSFDELLELAFRDKLITDGEHPLVLRLLGAS